jgi:CO/xanthine dehydrogenase Mo-binding subunit
MMGSTQQSLHPLQGVGAIASPLRGDAMVTGRAKYAADLSFPGMLWGKLLYAESAPALIKRIDVSRALESEGAVAVMTAADIPGLKYYTYALPDMPVLAVDRVRYTGEAVAMVAAESLELAQRALDKIVVEYEPLEGIFDPVEAMKEGAPRIQENKENILDHALIEWGDLEKGFSEATVIVEQTYQTPLVEHAFMETEASVALCDEEYNVTVYSPTQSPHRDRRQIAAILGVPEPKVQVKVPPVGGGFGGKAELAVQPHAALLAMKTLRPVKVVRSREESIKAHVKRHPMTIHYKSGASSDGHLTAVQVEVIGDTGPYANAGFEVVGFATEMSTGPYQVPNGRLEGYTVLTHNPICGAMRGFGLPQVTFAYERQMDLLAERLGLDPLEIRLKNAIEQGSVLGTGATVYQPPGLREVLIEATNHADWAGRHTLERRPAPHLRRGVGLACCWQGTGLGANLPDHATVQVEMVADGGVIVRCGAPDMGQGAYNVVTQIVAEELQLPLTRINLPLPDTHATSDCVTAEASRQTYVVGNAVLRAATQLREKVVQVAAQMWECSPDDVGLSDGSVIFFRGEQTSAFSNVAHYAYEHNIPLSATGFARMPTANPQDLRFPFAHAYFSCGAQVAQVLVDVETGHVTVERIVAAHDVGKAINPLGVIGQIEGGVAMGYGWATIEELLYSKDQCQTPSLAEYLVPTAGDLPEIIPLVVEVPDPEGPYGAKGLGEQTLSPTAPAIANAVADAVGVRVQSIPITPERVLAALARKAGGG